MTDVNRGAATSNVPAILLAGALGQVVGGARHTQNQTALVSIIAYTADSASGVTEDDSARTTPDAGVSLGAAVYDITATAGDVWFERVHIVPSSLIDFGNIITQVEDLFELYNAFTEQQVVITAITNNVAPGVEVPDVVPPRTIEAGTSVLRSTSTDNRTGTPGLGTLVLLRVQALTTGLPKFDGAVVFEVSAPGADVALLVSGQRIVLIPFEYEVEVEETLECLTDVQTARSGKEARASLRAAARQEFAVEYRLVDNEQQQLIALLFDWHANLFGFPLWHERCFLTATAAALSTTLTTAGADEVDFRVGGLVGIITDSLTFEVIEIATVGPTSITLTDPLTGTYPIGTAIVPVRLSRLASAVQGERSPVNLETLRCKFEVDDNDTGAREGTLTPGFWSTFNGRVLLNDGNVVEGARTPVTYQRRIHVIDNQIGKVSSSSYWDRDKRLSSKGFLARSRAEIQQLRDLFLGLRGQQTAFYIPTRFAVVTAVANLSSGAFTLDIAFIGYTRFVRDRSPFTTIALTFTDGTTITRTVVSSVEVSSSVERLTVSVAWASTKTPAEVELIELYELARFASDKMVLRYPRIGQARATMPVLRVFDDNP